MTVDRVSENKVMITLCGKDMKDFSLDFETLSLDDYHSRKILLRIMQIACFKSGIDVKNKEVLMEALPISEGCCILMTVTERRPHRHYKLKKNSKSLCYCLGDSKNFLDTIEKLYKQNVYCNKNSAYLFEGDYYLIFDYPSIPQKLRIVLGEYAEKREEKAAGARIKENGKLLCKYNAIAQIGRWM